MKKLLCFLLCLTLIFSSVSLCFATPVDWDSSDSQHLTEIRNALVSGGTIYNLINAVNSNIVNLNSNLVTLMGWLDPSTGGSTTAILNRILSMLAYTDAGGALKSWLMDIEDHTDNSNIYLSSLITNLFTNTYQVWGTNIGPNGTISTWTSQSGNWITAMFWHLQDMKGNFVQNYQNVYAYLANGYNAQQTSSNWLDLSNVNWTPTSVTNGIYTWLSNIQRPLARLSYVLASDERIEAQEAAAANEEAVVDNFIVSSGDGAASPSDIGSMSDLSSGYKQNFGSDASPSGIFDIFNSDHATWFSQETKNQLDTTTPTRLSKGSASETPLLDKQIQDIYDALGVKQP